DVLGLGIQNDCRRLVCSTRLLWGGVIGHTSFVNLPKNEVAHLALNFSVWNSWIFHPFLKLRFCGPANLRPLRFLRRNLLLQLSQFLVLLVGRKQQRRHGRGGGEVRRLPGFVDVLEEGEERVEVLLREWVKLVVVAARAFEGLAEECGAEGVDAI